MNLKLSLSVDRVLMWICVFSEESNVERACDTLLMCIVTVLNHGLRNGGGVGDVLRKPSKDVSSSSLVSLSTFGFGTDCLSLLAFVVANCC